MIVNNYKSVLLSVKINVLIKNFQMFQKKFTDAVVSYNNQSNVSDSISSFTPAALDELVESFTEISYLRIGIGYGLMVCEMAHYYYV